MRQDEQHNFSRLLVKGDIMATVWVAFLYAPSLRASGAAASAVRMTPAILQSLA